MSARYHKEILQIDCEAEAGRICAFIVEQMRSLRRHGIVIGISGGIDSAVVAVLCQRAFPQNTMAINLPCYSNPEDQVHARLVAEKFSIHYEVVILDSIYDNLLKILFG